MCILHIEIASSFIDVTESYIITNNILCYDEDYGLFVFLWWSLASSI